MAYNRLGDYPEQMDHRGSPYRTPSPGHPLQQGYQLEENPYNQQQRLTPGPQGQYQRYGTPSDQLDINAAHSVDNLSYGGHHQGGYGDTVVNPELMHDEYGGRHATYPNQPPHDDGYYDQRPHDDGHGYDLDDRRPMLEHQNSAFEDAYHDQPPQQQQQMGPGIKRWKTVKQVLLYRGNLVLDCPVPPILLQQNPHGERDEFTHMRYTAATCDPSDFYNENFTLRQKLFSKPRHTELFIVVTMYNEDDVLFARTMIGVFKNIEYMCNRPNSKTWGSDAWKKIVVCVVSDGRSKINPRTKAVLSGMGVYQEGIAKQQVNGKDVTSHIYEYTTQTHLTLKNDVVGLVHKRQPVQMLFCLKEKNQKKINSHRWFFQAFGRVLDPNICVLLDAGTRPGGNSIYHLWKAFDLEPMCGERLRRDQGHAGHGWQEPHQPAPPRVGIWLHLRVAGRLLGVSLRRAAKRQERQGTLEKYFLGETLHGGSSAGLFESNMYLAEDRILCFELVTKRNCHWILQYVKSANGETDVPDTVTELVLQRRRWLNGSFFAAIYAIAHFHEFFRSDHSMLRKLAFFVEFVFQTVNMIFAWFAIGNFFLVFKILTTSLGNKDLLGKTGEILGVVFTWLYGVCLITCFVLSMGNRPAGSGKLYSAMVWFWACIMIYLMFAAIFIAVKAIIADVNDADGFSIDQLFKNPVFYTLIISVMSTFGIWLIASLIMFDPWHMITSFVQYMLLTPTYTNVLNVATTRWRSSLGQHKGRPGQDGPPRRGRPQRPVPARDFPLQHKVQGRQDAPTAAQLQEKQMDYYRGVRTGVVLIWMITNFALAAVVLSSAGLEKITPTRGSLEDEQLSRSNIYMTIVLWSVAVLSGFKFLGALWFLIVRMFRGV
ncbi:hypothetical protein ACCO45_000203 [Purpureocillium lilacinum]|uniref:Uncharacterized protein n=1 Tax=Purpureocillium lilacinum TaxID=33203 RepID=A0ACC4E3J0_PURLI